MAKKKLTLNRTLKDKQELEQIMYKSVTELKLPVYVYMESGQASKVSEGYIKDDNYWFLYDWGAGVDLNCDDIRMIIIERDSDTEVIQYPGITPEKPAKPRAKKRKAESVVQE